MHKLVWYEVHDSVEAAIRRKKQIKEWKRDWKINLIERDNRHWLDLYAGLDRVETIRRPEANKAVTPTQVGVHVPVARCAER